MTEQILLGAWVSEAVYSPDTNLWASSTSPQPDPLQNVTVSKSPASLISSSPQPGPSHGYVVADSPLSQSHDSISSDNTNTAVLKPRKRLKRQSAQALRKKARNSGAFYKTKSNKEVPSKQFTNAPCTCTRKCHETISELERRALFQSFWAMESFQSQNTYLCGLIVQTPTSTRRPVNYSRAPKEVTNTFRLQNCGENIVVCKPFFLQTFQVTDGRVTRAIKKPSQGLDPGSDQRGRHSPSNKTPEQVLMAVHEHINSFPVYQSHYTRHKNPHRKFLPAHLNIRKMFNLYEEKLTGSDESNAPVKEGVYRRIFNTEFILAFHVPLTDTCAKCDSLKIKIDATDDEEEKTALIKQKDDHLLEAEKTRNCLKEDGNKAKSNSHYYTITFDFEKALRFPILTVSETYYKRNMYVYNLGCHELHTGKGFMYVWDETIASRGAQEVSSCVVKHLKLHTGSAKHVIEYSDSCPGQNRNLKIVLRQMHFLANQDDTSIEVIDHKFMVSGHSYLPNDADFGSIENAAKAKDIIYTPSDWYDVMKGAQPKKPFTVTEMNQMELQSTVPLEKMITRRKKTVDNKEYSWLKIRWIRIRKDEPFTMFFKETLDEDAAFLVLSLLPARVGRPMSMRNVSLPPLYDESRPVTKAKKKDMRDLLKYIPPVHHDYFVNLKTDSDENIEDIGPLELVDVEYLLS